MLKNTAYSYGSITKIFHWVSSIIIITLICVGFIMASMEPSEQKWSLYGAHKATGVILLTIVTLRLLWRLSNIVVSPPNGMPHWQHIASKLTHYALYVCMFLMPVSGLLMSILGGYEVNVFGLFTIPAMEKNAEISEIFVNIHGITAFVISGLVILHVLAALYHHFIRKDEVLIRMIK